jgi:ketol-acid reductoisomerase
MGTNTRLWWPEEIGLEVLSGRNIGVIGYGNQGAAQACNLRDSGFEVLIGNVDDDYGARASADGFEVVGIAEAADRCDTVLFLVPDEVQPEVFAGEVAPAIEAGDCLVVASGYNLTFGGIEDPTGVDTVMVAPRMVGDAVRSRAVAGRGSPSLVSVERDTSEVAESLALGIAKAAGVASPAISSSAREEAAVDLFSEQALWPVLTAAFQAAYDVLSSHGFSDEAVLYELYLSGEPSEVFRLMTERGYFGQLPVHSHTSQYGQLTAETRELAVEMARRYSDVLDGEILSGRFAARWGTVLREQPAELHRLLVAASVTPLGKADEVVRGKIHR